MREIVVQGDNLVKKYGDFAAVDGISFGIYRGDVFSFLGLNGAGKTATVEILECLRRLTSGSAKVLGYDVSRESDGKEIRKKIGVLPLTYFSDGLRAAMISQYMPRIVFNTAVVGVLAGSLYSTGRLYNSLERKIISSFLFLILPLSKINTQIFRLLRVSCYGRVLYRQILNLDM